MKKFMIMILGFGLLISSNLNAMLNEELLNKSNISVKLDIKEENNPDPTINKSSRSSSSSNNSSIELEEQNIISNEETQTHISIGTKLKGYTVRCGTIMCTTLLGGAIGLAIVSGEISPESAYILLKAGSPILIGSLIGYGIGWGIGNTCKARITGRC